jgi:hypothetical protein
MARLPVWSGDQMQRRLLLGGACGSGVRARTDLLLLLSRAAGVSEQGAEWQCAGDLAVKALLALQLPFLTISDTCGS